MGEPEWRLRNSGSLSQHSNCFFHVCTVRSSIGSVFVRLHADLLRLCPKSSGRQTSDGFAVVRLPLISPRGCLWIREGLVFFFCFFFKSWWKMASIKKKWAEEQVGVNQSSRKSTLSWSMAVKVRTRCSRLVSEWHFRMKLIRFKSLSASSRLRLWASVLDSRLWGQWRCLSPTMLRPPPLMSPAAGWDGRSCDSYQQATAGSPTNRTMLPRSPTFYSIFFQQKKKSPEIWTF